MHPPCTVRSRIPRSRLGWVKSRQPLQFGLGQAATADDVVRIQWPRRSSLRPSWLCRQGRFTVFRNSAAGARVVLVLLTWDGKKSFVFVTDYSWVAGSMGELAADGIHAPAAIPRNRIKIEPGQTNGSADGAIYHIKIIAEPMDEVLFLDWLQLDVIDHPKDTAVYSPYERFAGRRSRRHVQDLYDRFDIASASPSKTINHRGPRIVTCSPPGQGRSDRGSVRPADPGPASP